MRDADRDIEIGDDRGLGDVDHVCGGRREAEWSDERVGHAHCTVAHGLCQGVRGAQAVDEQGSRECREGTRDGRHVRELLISFLLSCYPLPEVSRTCCF